MQWRESLTAHSRQQENTIIILLWHFFLHGKLPRNGSLGGTLKTTEILWTPSLSRTPSFSSDKTQIPIVSKGTVSHTSTHFLLEPPEEVSVCNKGWYKLCCNIHISKARKDCNPTSATSKHLCWFSYIVFFVLLETGPQLAWMTLDSVLLLAIGTFQLNPPN